MKYLLCSVYRGNYDRVLYDSMYPMEPVFIISGRYKGKDAVPYRLETEEFDSFVNAIKEYTLKCAFCPEVTLSELHGEEWHILKQYSKDARTII